MIINPIEMSTAQVNNMRLYNTPAGQLPSITTILGITQTVEKVASLESWRNSLGHANAKKVTHDAAERGTKVHTMCERFLRGEDIIASQFSYEDVNAFTALKLKLKNIKPIVQEVALYSDTLGVAGRVDCIGYYKDIPSIIDFKTSRKNKTDKDIYDYKLQIAFYQFAANEMYDLNIDNGVVLMSSGSGFPLEFSFKPSDFYKDLEKRINAFYQTLL